MFCFSSQSPPRPSSRPYSQSPPLSRTPQRATFTVGSPYSTSPSSPRMQQTALHSPNSSPSSAESSPIEMRIRRRTNSSPRTVPRGELSTSPRPIPRPHTVSGCIGGKQGSSRKSPSPTQHSSSTSGSARKQQNSSPKLSGTKGTVKGSSMSKGGQESSPVFQKEVPAQFGTKASPTTLTEAVQLMNEQAQAPDAAAFAGFSSTDVNKGLARPASCKIRRALSNIEHLVSKDTSPILTALACQSNAGMGIPITDLSEPGAENKQMIRVHSCPAILAMGLPRKTGTLLTTPGFQLGGGATPPVYHRSLSGGYSPLKAKTPPLSSSPSSTALPTIPGSPTKTSHSSKDSAVDPDREMKPLRGLFTVGSSSPLDSDAGIFYSPGQNFQNRKTSTGEKPAVVSQGTGCLED